MTTGGSDRDIRAHQRAGLLGGARSRGAAAAVLESDSSRNYRRGDRAVPLRGPGRASRALPAKGPQPRRSGPRVRLPVPQLGQCPASSFAAAHRYGSGCARERVRTWRGSNSRSPDHGALMPIAPLHASQARHCNCSSRVPCLCARSRCKPYQSGAVAIRFVLALQGRPPFPNDWAWLKPRAAAVGGMEGAGGPLAYC